MYKTRRLARILADVSNDANSSTSCCCVALCVLISHWHTPTHALHIPYTYKHMPHNRLKCEIIKWSLTFAIRQFWFFGRSAVVHIHTPCTDCFRCRPKNRSSFHSHFRSIFFFSFSSSSSFPFSFVNGDRWTTQFFFSGPTNKIEYEFIGIGIGYIRTRSCIYTLNEETKSRRRPFV